MRERETDYAFDHELVRALVTDETSLARRRLLHARAAELPGSPRAVVARHLELAGRDAAAAVAYLEAAEDAGLAEYVELSSRPGAAPVTVSTLYDQTEGNPHFGRNNAVMSAMAKTLTANDIDQVTSWLSSLPGELRTVPQAKFK